MSFCALDRSSMLRETLAASLIGCSSEPGFSWDQKSTQGGGRKTENKRPQVLGSSEVLVPQIVLKVNLFLCLQTSCIDIFQTSGSVFPPRRPYHNGSSRLRQIHRLTDKVIGGERVWVVWVRQSLPGKSQGLDQGAGNINVSKT